MALKRNFKLTSEASLRVRATGEDKGFIETQSVQALLLYAILQELQSQRTLVENLEQDRDEWRRQHENLLAVHRQDIDAMAKKITTRGKVK